MAMDFSAARSRMVETQLKPRGIRSAAVLRAFLAVPRHEFVPEDLAGDAYRDCPLPIGEGQTISQPYMVATMTEALAVDPGLRILEIGTGSGYQAAILVSMGARVYSIERLPAIACAAEERLARLGYRVELRVGDGTLGWPEAAPFDRIVVTAGAPSLPAPLVEQLVPGGRLVIPIDEGFSQVLRVFELDPAGLTEERREHCTFVPLIGEHGWKR